MMLTIRQYQVLRKAGKQGLVAIQKQVTKKGKTFTQTFYVKPDSLPKRPTSPTAIASGLPAPQHPTITVSNEAGDTYTFEANHPKGFVINSTKGTKTPIRIPEQYIAKMFKYAGQTFVVHRVINRISKKVLGQYQTTELLTGLSVGAESDSVDGAEANGKHTVAQHGEATLKEIVDKSDKMSDKIEVDTSVDGWTVEEPKQFLNDTELDESAREIWNSMLAGESGGITLDQVKEWMSDKGEIETEEDVKDVLQDYDMDSLRSAIELGLSYYDADTRFEAISKIHKLSSRDWKTIADWAANNENDLIGGFNSYDYGTSSDYGNEWSDADVVAYAIDNNISLYDAQQYAKDSTQKKDEEEYEEHADDLGNFAFTDSYGVYWDSSSILSISRWVNGTVETTRDAANSLDDCRRRNVEISDECNSNDAIVDTIEQNGVEYTGTTLYRGTGNRAWLESEIGDSVVVGCASFSKSESRATKFDDTVMLIMEPNEVQKDHPIMGVDVDQLNKDAEANISIYDETGMEVYAKEQEFIVRAPTLRITKREGHRVWVQPVEMNLLSVMKALFLDKADREAAMAETFKYHMRQDTEDKWIS